VKRSPINRVPLRPGTGEQPVRSSLRRVALAQQSKRRIKDGPVRAAAERELGRVALEGECARCGRFGYVNGHERVRRSQGGDPRRPDCLLCPVCNDWAANGSPMYAAWDGWTVTPKYDRSPSLMRHQALRVDGRIHTFGGTDDA
jgi:hypothetical protein